MKIKQQINALLTLMLLLVIPARAVDGVIEINQTCATQTGCFSGDSSGFPVSIDGTVGYSYKLTSDLIIPDTNTTGIRINVANVQLDLNGFSIIGIDCLGAPIPHCRPTTGIGGGIRVLNTSSHGISIKNGSVIGMGDDGVSLNGQTATINHIHLRWNGDDGIRASNNSILINITAIENGGNGIVCARDCLIERNVSNFNLDNGIRASFGSMVINNVSSHNLDHGLRFTSSVNSGSYRESTFRNNGMGTANFGLDLGNNDCNGTTVCP